MDINSEFKSFANSMGVNSMLLHDYQKHQNRTPMVGPIGMTPNVIEERQLNAVTMSVFDRLMLDRQIFLGVGIDSNISNILTAQLLFLENINPDKDITMLLNSPGGSVLGGLGIYDTMQFIKPDVSTMCTGMAASMGAVLLCAGATGKRYSLKHSRVMIHQPLGGMQGQASDMEITVREIQKLKKELYTIISDNSNKSYDEVWEDSDRDYWMTSQEAKDYGMIDDIIIKK